LWEFRTKGHEQTQVRSRVANTAPHDLPGNPTRPTDDANARIDSELLWKLRSVPSSAERLDKKDAGLQTPLCYVNVVSLVLQESRLRGDHLQVSIPPPS